MEETQDLKDNNDMPKLNIDYKLDEEDNNIKKTIPEI